MRTEIRQKTVDYEVYIANDDTEFNSERECKDYEARKSGDRITCPKCGGAGHFQGRWVKPGYDSSFGPIEGHYEYNTCDRCGGKGYLDKKTTWE